MRIGGRDTVLRVGMAVLLMSALGQKQTCAAQKVMSALPPKADMCGAKANVRFVPKADIRASPYSEVMNFPTVKPAKPPTRAKAYTSQTISNRNM